MKKKLNAIFLIMVISFCCLMQSGCNEEKNVTDLWETATYKTDTEFGDGKTTVTVNLKVNEKSVTFTINTEKPTLGEALTEHELILGENDVYGMYVKKVNGIEADYDKDKSYWAFYKDGDYLVSGVDTTEISDGDCFEIVYTK